MLKFNKKLRPNTRVALGIFSVFSAALIPTPQLFAQAPETKVEEVVVTGSRIPQNANLSSPSPVTSVGADEFLYTGITRVEDLLNDLPQVTGSNSSNDSYIATGTATVNLRSLGPERTLTLVNGRRLPTGSPVQGAQGADLNFIPSALVKRVEVVTGGGSATYGTDAVAGVVNFIMKDDLDGFIVDFQGSAYQHNNNSSDAETILNNAGFDAPSGSVIDGESFTLSMAYGKNFDNGNGNFTSYLTYRDTKDIQQSERDYSACTYGGRRADDSISCIGSGTIPDGRFVVLEDFADYKVSGDQFIPTDGTTFNFAPTNYFQRPDERITAGFFADYDLSESMNVYTEVGYMNSQTLAQIAPSGSFFNTINISCNNPLLSAQQVQLLCGAYGLSGSDVSPALVAKRNVEGGARANDIELEQTRIVVGLRGQMTETWNYDVSANYGKVDLAADYLNDLSITNIGRSLNVVADASGNAVCQSVLDGTDPNCVPWNLFESGQVTQAALDYIDLPLSAKGNTNVTNLIGFVTGDMTDAGWVVPGASSGVQLVAGLEYRKEELNFNPDANYQSGDGAGQGGPTVAVNGSYAANELFTEAKIPFTDSINLVLGYRYSDYDTDQQTDALKTTFDWQISNSFKTRASYQAATRHANVRELFRPQGIGLFNGGNDPCDGVVTATLAQCARSGVTDAQYGNILENPAGQYNELQGGNEELEPEESDTYSVGFVITPEAVPGLDLTIDWYSIDVEGAIDNAGSQFIIDSCVFSNQFCDRINRGPNGTLWLGTAYVENTNANIGFEKREGIDLSLNYAFEAGNLGSMRLSYNTTYSLTYDYQSVPDSDIVDCNGKFNGNCFQPDPEYRHNMRLSWDVTDAITTSLAWRHSGKVEEDTTDEVVERISSQNYFDISMLWAVNNNATVRFGINNIFDKEPPTSGASGDWTNGNVEVTEYDALGRYLFIGANYQF